MFGDDIFLSDVPAPKQLLNTFNEFSLLPYWPHSGSRTRRNTFTDASSSSQAPSGRWRASSRSPKPEEAPSNWVQVGYFVLSYQVFDMLTGSEIGKGGELWMADAVDRLAARATVIAQPIEGKWMAAGDPLRQLKASIEATLQRQDMRDDLIAYLRSLNL